MKNIEHEDAQKNVLIQEKRKDITINLAQAGPWILLCRIVPLITRHLNRYMHILKTMNKLSYYFLTQSLAMISWALHFQIVNVLLFVQQ
mgnify:CR=1 FL=1